MEVSIPMYIVDRALWPARERAIQEANAMRLQRKNHDRRLANKKLREAYLTEQTKDIEC